MKYLAWLILFLGFQDQLFAAEGLSKKSIYQLDQNWTNQDGKAISFQQLPGHLTLTTMMFTNCPGSCPLMVSDMKSFEKELTKDEKTKIRFVGFSMDPDRDKPEALKKFFKKMKLDTRWTLLTSNADQVRELAAVFGFGYKAIGDGNFTHSSTLYLLSSDGEILASKERNSDWKEFLEKFRSEVKKAKK